MDFNTLTSLRIKELRTSLGLKAEAIAQELGMDKSSYSNLENGKLQITVDKLNRLAEVFAVPVITLLPESVSQHQTVNVHNGENSIFNGPQINNNYTDSKIVDAIMELLKNRQ